MFDYLDFSFDKLKSLPCSLSTQNAIWVWSQVFIIWNVLLVLLNHFKTQLKGKTIKEENMFLPHASLIPFIKMVLHKFAFISYLNLYFLFFRKEICILNIFLFTSHFLIIICISTESSETILWSTHMKLFESTLCFHLVYKRIRFIHIK